MSLDIDAIRRAFPGRRIEYYPTIDSTMNAAAACGIGTIVLAGEQTAGVGRHGHSWHSEAGAGIYCSLVLLPSPLLTLALGIATSEAISRATGLACDLRWPNDVMVGRSKLAGILIQLADAKAIAGIGINVNQTAFPPDIEAISLSQALARGPIPREPLVIELIRAVDNIVREDSETILRLFTQASSYAMGRRVIVQQPGAVIEGVTAGLDRSGFLIVRQDNGTDTLIIAGGVRAAGS